MLAISFGWTWPAFVAREKSVTRRDWKPKHALKFRIGTEFLALDKDFRYGGVGIGNGRVTAEVIRQPLKKMPDADYAAEGFAFFAEHPQALPSGARKQTWAADGVSSSSLFDQWRRAGGTLYVVRFEILDVTAEALRRLEALLG